MSSKKDLENVISVLEDRIDALESIYSILEKEQPEWYKREPFQNTMCWVSNTHKNPIEVGIIRLITGYDETSSFPFRISNCYISNYKYAVPISTNDLLEYSLEHQMEQEK